jgi:YD repeat-containing protein
VSRITTAFNGTEQVVAQNVQYHPFGGVQSYTLGNGQIVARTIDLDGRIAGYTLGNESYAISFDAASRITGIAQAGNAANANAYGYDELDRLTSAVLTNAAYGYGYDAVGNRLSKTTGAATDLYAYSATSNRIASLTPASGPARSFVFDPNGSTTSDGLNSYGFDARGRMASATSSAGSTAYQVNALGQRVRKTHSQGSTLFHYDTRGRLIAETDALGNLRREVLYLGDLPLAVLQ